MSRIDRPRCRTACAATVVTREAVGAPKTTLELHCSNRSTTCAWQNLCGVLDENLRQIETAFDVTIAVAAKASGQRRPGAIARWHRRAAAFLRAGGEPLSVDDIQLGLIEITVATAMPARGTAERC
jgi:hypothetical protein